MQIPFTLLGRKIDTLQKLCLAYFTHYMTFMVPSRVTSSWYHFTKVAMNDLSKSDTYDVRGMKLGPGLKKVANNM